MRHVARILTPLLANWLCPAEHRAQDSPSTSEALDTSGLVAHAEEAFEGFTLIAPLTAHSILMLDMKGEVVHRWDPGNPTESCMLLEDGHLLRWGVTPGENPRFKGPGVDGGIVEELGWEGQVVWRYVLDNDEQLLHHDIALLPNGNILFLAWEHRYPEDAKEWGRDPAQVKDDGMWPDAVYEIRPTRPTGAEIVWEWHVWDHVIQDHDASKRNYGSVKEKPGKVDINADHRGRTPMSAEEIEALRELEGQMAALGYGGAPQEEEDEPRTGTAPDWLHTNAIDYLPEHDLIVLSVPNLGELWIIDHSTTTDQAAWSTGGRFGRGGDLLWRWGNPRNYGAGDASDQKLFYQHDPTWLPSQNPGELRLLVFNNGRERPGAPYSSVEELVVPFDSKSGFPRPSERPYGPEGSVWSYSDPGTFYSSFISGAQRLPNGNTLICSGAQGRVFEVTPDGRVVWDFRNPHTGKSDLGIPVNALYRAVRIPKDHPGLAGREF